MNSSPGGALSGELIIETVGLRKSYRSRHGDRLAVDHLDLAVPRGGVHGFLGPNGSGKTTTIRMLLGLIRPDGGQIRLFGQPVPARLPNALRKIGAIVEQPRFVPGFTGRKNLSLLADMIGATSAPIDDVLSRVGLNDRGDDRYKSYSLGMRQRLAIASALLKTPELLILDEPTNGLDPAGIREMRSLVKELGESGVTVLMSSHILAEVEQVCDSLSIIGRGRLLASGSVHDVVTDPNPTPIEVGLGDLSRGKAVLVDAGMIVSIRNGRLYVEGVAPPSAVTRELAAHGMYVDALIPLAQDLESVFLELTSGEELGVPKRQPDKTSTVRSRTRAWPF